MDLKLTESLARAQIAQHLPGWRFEFADWRTSMFGVCYYQRQLIRLSAELVTMNSEDKVRDTLMHEIAHGVSFLRHGRLGTGHGWQWRMVAAELGATPRACYSVAQVWNEKRALAAFARLAGPDDWAAFAVAASEKRSQDFLATWLQENSEASQVQHAASRPGRSWVPA